LISAVKTKQPGLSPGRAHITLHIYFMHVLNKVLITVYSYGILEIGCLS